MKYLKKNKKLLCLPFLVLCAGIFIVLWKTSTRDDLSCRLNEADIYSCKILRSQTVKLSNHHLILTISEEDAKNIYDRIAESECTDSRATNSLSVSIFGMCIENFAYVRASKRERAGNITFFPRKFLCVFESAEKLRRFVADEDLAFVRDYTAMRPEGFGTSEEFQRSLNESKCLLYVDVEKWSPQFLAALFEENRYELISWQNSYGGTEASVVMKRTTIPLFVERDATGTPFLLSSLKECLLRPLR